jgi:hypothetical protein
MFKIIIFTAHCTLFINRKFLANVRNRVKFSENRKMLTFSGDGENKLSKAAKNFAQTICSEGKV